MPAVRQTGITGPVNFGGAAYREYATGFLRERAAVRGVVLPAPDPGEIAGADAINTVFCHADRWIVQCPDCGQDYQFVWPDDRLFMCSHCWNGGVGGKYRRYAMPAGWTEVNVEMGRAPDPVLRNWVPTGVMLKGAIASQPRQTMLEVITEMRTYG